MVFHVLLVLFVFAILIYLLERILHKDNYAAEGQFPGPRGYWYFGSAFDYINLNSKGEYVTNYAAPFPKLIMFVNRTILNNTISF